MAILSCSVLAKTAPSRAQCVFFVFFLPAIHTARVSEKQKKNDLSLVHQRENTQSNLTQFYHTFSGRDIIAIGHKTRTPAKGRNVFTPLLESRRELSRTTPRRLPFASRGPRSWSTECTCSVQKWALDHLNISCIQALFYTLHRNAPNKYFTHITYMCVRFQKSWPKIVSDVCETYSLRSAAGQTWGTVCVPTRCAVTKPVQNQ